MLKETIFDIRADIKSKRDALLIAHQKLKSDNDDWNKGVIIISLVTGLLESIKMKLHLEGAGWSLAPILLSSITATMASLIKFRNFGTRMETYLQSASLLTNTLLKARNHTVFDNELKIEYNQSLEKIENALYPNERKMFLKLAHKNLIEIMAQEQKYYDKIDKVNKHELILSDDSSISSDEKEIEMNKTNYKINPLNSVNEKDVESLMTGGRFADEEKK